MRLEDKTALVTGAGSGFGEGIARRFAEEGAAVMVVDIDADAAKRVAEEIGGDAFAHTADVADSLSVKGMFSRARSRFDGRLDCLVCNAGVPQRNGPMWEVDEDTFDRIYAVNVKSLYYVAQHGLDLLKEEGGSIIVTSSTAAERPRPGLTWYNGSKGAASVITKSMALELAPYKVRVNAIHPVIGDTGMVSEFMGGEDTPEIREKFVATVPLGRMSTPLDIANACLFLASDDAVFITGTCIEVDGGRCV
ncbi:glucose 1-dehydrogenase [Minwuia sp.]|uniref:glucose 1-dehydrogenase n=1 Tax=Minwuia sp. TaxID=2493630 RepID=UPI003A8E4E2C